DPRERHPHAERVLALFHIPRVDPRGGDPNADLPGARLGGGHFAHDEDACPKALPFVPSRFHGASDAFPVELGATRDEFARPIVPPRLQRCNRPRRAGGGSHPVRVRAVALADARCRLPGLPGGASSRSTRFRPPEARAARGHTSPTRKSTRTHTCGKLRSGKTSASGRRRLRRAPAGSGTWGPKGP